MTLKFWYKRPLIIYNRQRTNNPKNINMKVAELQEEAVRREMSRLKKEREEEARKEDGEKETRNGYTAREVTTTQEKQARSGLTKEWSGWLVVRYANGRIVS